MTEEIVSREVEYLDSEGLIAEVRVLWSVGGWSAPNWSQAKLKGLKLNMLEREAGHDAEGEGTADEATYELVQTVPLPRRFVTRIWVPRGPPWSTPFSSCAPTRRRRRATSRGGTTTSRRTTARCFERMRAAPNDDARPPRILRGRRLLACDVCGWVHYAMTARWAFNKKLAHPTKGRGASFTYTRYLNRVLPVLQDVIAEIERLRGKPFS